MSLIDSLTEKQKALFPEYVKRWTDIGLSTDPANRREAEDGVKESYRIAGRTAPKKIVWCGSPLSQGLTRLVIQKICSDKTGASVWDSVRASVGDSVGASVRDSVRASVGDSVGDSVWASVWASVRDSVGASVWDSVGDSVGASVRASVGASVRDSVGASGYGQHDAGWLSFYAYFNEACKLVDQTKKLNGLWRICKSSGWWLPHQNICWISERHNVLNRDDRGRLHCENGPAVAYPDGWEIHAWHGVRVSKDLIENPQSITTKQIESEQNAEVRRVMMERYGHQRYLLDSGAKKIHSDDWGTLYRKEIPGDEPLVMIKVVNSTPEPDGSLKDYFLRVPPNMERAKQAVAWTFGKTEKEYAPAMQT